VINIGDILERMTGGLYQSNLHRVKNIHGKSRFGIPYFYDPGWDSEVKKFDLKVNEEEKLIQEKALRTQRWDSGDLHAVAGNYGKYLINRY